MQCRNRVPILGWVLIVTFGFLIVVTAQASSPLAGTWRLDVAKSKYSPGPAPKSGTYRYEVTRDGLKAVLDGVNAQGQKTHTEYSCGFDGKDCAYHTTVDGKPSTDPNATAAIYWKRTDDHTFEYAGKSKGRITGIGHVVISKDGRVQTRTVTGTDAQGRKVDNTVILEKQ